MQSTKGFILREAWALVSRSVFPEYQLYAALWVRHVKIHWTFVPLRSWIVPTWKCLQTLENPKSTNSGGGSEYRIGGINQRRLPREGEDIGYRNTQVTVWGWDDVMDQAKNLHQGALTEVTRSWWEAAQSLNNQGLLFSHPGYHLFPPWSVKYSLFIFSLHVKWQNPEKQIN